MKSSQNSTPVITIIILVNQTAVCQSE